MIHILKNILLYFIFLGSLFSDECTNNVSIQENFFNEDIIGYYLSAIDLESGESNVLLFDYSIDMSEALSNPLCAPENMLGAEDVDDCLLIENTDPSLNPCAHHNIATLWFDFEISMYVPSIEGFSTGPTTLVDGRVRLDNIPNNLSELSFRNTDLNLETSNLQGGTTFHLENHNISIDNSDIENLTEILLSHGRLPNGIYYFSFFLKDAHGNDIDQLTEEIEVFVPSYLELITPGSSTISDTLSNVVMTTNPIFQWKSIEGVSKYEIQVSSNEDFSEILWFSSEIRENNTVFPKTGSEQLSYNQIYYWRVRAWDDERPLGDFSVIYKFDISGENKVVLEGPLSVESETLLPYFSWEAVKGAS